MVFRKIIHIIFSKNRTCEKPFLEVLDRLALKGESIQANSTYYAQMAGTSGVSLVSGYQCCCPLPPFLPA